MIDYNGEDQDKEDIISCAAMIVTTVQGTMPYMRDMGIPGGMPGNVLDKSASLEMNLIDQIEEWEERAVVEQVSMKQDATGKLIPKVVIGRNAESN